MNWTFDNDTVTIDVTYDEKADHPKGELVIRFDPIDLYELDDVPNIIIEMVQALLEGAKAWNEK